MGSRVSAHNGPGEATLTPSILVRIQGSPSHVAPFGKKLRSHLKLHDLRFPERINEVACKVIGCRLGCCKLLTRILLPERETHRHQAHDEMLLPSGQAGDFARIRSRESWTRFTRPGQYYLYAVPCGGASATQRAGHQFHPSRWQAA